LALLCHPWGFQQSYPEKGRKKYDKNKNTAAGLVKWCLNSVVWLFVFWALSTLSSLNDAYE
jgi:hypothetical protein